MKSGFKDPTAIKSQDPKDHPKDGKNTPWEHQQPQYDQRSSCFVNAGTHYGVGHKQPVGHENDPKMRVSTLPYGKVNTMKDDERG
jgi:hypothetical protein